MGLPELYQTFPADKLPGRSLILNDANNYCISTRTGRSLNLYRRTSNMSCVSCSVNQVERQMEFKFSDGSSATLCLQQVARSSVLQNALEADTHAGNRSFELNMNVQYFQSWIRAMDLLDSDGPLATSNAGDIAQCIQVWTN